MYKCFSALWASLDEVKNTPRMSKILPLTEIRDYSWEVNFKKNCQGISSVTVAQQSLNNEASKI